MNNTNSMKVQSVQLTATYAEIEALSGQYVVGRFYKSADKPKDIWYGVSKTELELVVAGTVFSALANAFNAFKQDTLTALDGKLGKTEQAVDSEKLAGKTYAQVKTDWATDIAAREAVIMAAIAGDVKHIYAINFQDGDTIDATKLDTSAGAIYANMPDGKFMFVLNGPAKASASITNYFGTDAPAVHTGSNNDHYLVTVAGGVVTSIARRNDVTNELMAAYQAALNELLERIQTVEGISGANGVTRNGNAFELGGELSKHTILEPGADNSEFMFAGMSVHNQLVISNKTKTKYFELVCDENGDLELVSVVPKAIAIHNAAHNVAHT